MCHICNEARHIPAAAPYRAECYRDSFLERQWSENRQRKSSPRAATRGRQSDIDRFMWRVARNQDWIRAHFLRLRRATLMPPIPAQEYLSLLD